MPGAMTRSTFTVELSDDPPVKGNEFRPEDRQFGGVAIEPYSALQMPMRKSAHPCSTI